MHGLLKLLIGFGIVFVASLIISLYSVALGIILFVFGEFCVMFGYGGYLYLVWLKRRGLD